MKKYKKKELLSAITLMEKVNEVINGQGEMLSSAMDLLSKCQESAILMGNYLETCGTSGMEIVVLLEDYCENLYQMSIELGNDAQLRNRAETIKAQLAMISDKIRRTIPADKKEIVFFPYKASMWDSMESIWDEAQKDKNCETYVVPIPYYDKNADGNLGNIYYEGDKFPKYVKTENWKVYNPEERRPDVAYIHNPYDSWNKVTCVHQNFHTKNLKKYVDKVVYVPYYITMNHVEKHFCVLPGVIYSDAVIVQTEKIKQTYLDELSEFERENGLKGAFTKDKFYVFGSPKIDKIMNIEQHKFDVPDSWKKLIYRDDNSKKKVILFNTSVQELLIHKEGQIEKIRKVIELFSLNKDVVLLWRPHPLSEGTVKSMLPELLQKYTELEINFQKEGKGIFDDTADLHRAIAISDAYYGTGGSLIPLYGLTGKPIMRENTQLLNIESSLKDRYVSFEDAYVDKNGDLWFCAIEFNSLFKYDIKHNELTWKGKFPNEKSEKRYCYSRCIAYKDKLYFPPYAAEEMAVYDIKNEKFQKIHVETYGIFGQKFYAMAEYNGKMFCFGAQIPAIMCMDLGNYEITYYDNIYKELSSFFINEDAPILNRDIIVDDNICFLSCGRANILLEFHMDDMSYQIHRVGKDENCYISMKKFRNKIYLVPRNDENVICYDYQKDTALEIVTPGKQCEKNAYFNTCEYDDELWLFPFKGQHIGRIAKGKEEIEIIENMSSYEKNGVFCENSQDYSEQKISWAHSDGNNIYYFSMMNKTLYIRNGQTGEVKKQQLLMKNEDFLKSRIWGMFNDRKTNGMAMQCVYNENNGTRLSNYIEWVSSSDNLKSEKQVELFLSEIADGHADCGRLCHRQFDLEG